MTKHKNGGGRHKHRGGGKHKKHDRPNGPPPTVVFPPNPNETGKEVVNRIYASLGLKDKYPPAVKEQVKELCQNDGITDPSLRDLNHLPYITIDNDDSMDLDQAMYICHADPPRPSSASLGEASGTDKKGADATTTSSGYLVSYALSDGAYYVPAATPLFDHVLRHRGGTSYYLPGKSIPMLPRALSEDVMSLNPNVRRRALVFDMYLDQDGNVLETTFCWAVIQSRWKGTYREVAEYYQAVDKNDDSSSSLARQEYVETLDLLREVGIRRIQLASDRNVVQYNRQASSIYIDDTDGLLKFGQRTRYISELYNEQISLLCNSEGAKLLHDFDKQEEAVCDVDMLQPIFRSQSPPRNEQVEVLESLLSNIIKAHHLNPIFWGWDRAGGVSLATYLKNIRQNLDHDDARQEEYHNNIIQVIERQAMMCNVAASFTPLPTNHGHHSLKLLHYARFSSPMREIVGCFTHKVLLEASRGAQTEGITTQDDYAIQKQVIRAARRGKELQKRLNGALFLHMMNMTFYKDLEVKPPDRPIYKGVIMGMDFSEERKSSRCYVRLQDPPIEIKVFGEDLNYHYMCRYGSVGEPLGHYGSTVEIAPRPGSFEEQHDDEEAVPTFRAGQRVCIQVSDYAKFYGQLSRSRWIFIMFPDAAAAAEKRQSIIRNSIVERDEDIMLDEDETEEQSDDTEEEDDE